MIGNIPTTDVTPDNGMGQRISLVHGHAVRQALTDIQHHAGGASTGIQTQDRRWAEVDRRRTVRLEEDFRRLLPIGHGIERCLG